MGAVLIDSDDWMVLVTETEASICPSCNSPDITMGACAVGPVHVLQEFVCESCQYEFTAVFKLTGYLPGLPDYGKA